MTTAHHEMDLTPTRLEIERIDKTICELFERRLTLVRGIATYKQNADLPIEDQDREAALLDMIAAHTRDEKNAEACQALERLMIDISKDVQREYTAAHLKR